MLELGDIVSELESWKEGRGVVMYGAGGTFCSGGDLTLMSGLLQTPQQGPKMSEYMHGILWRLHNLPLISAALVQGNILGGGTELMTAVDFRVASTTAAIGCIQAKMGLITGWGGGTRLVNLVGRHRALWLFSSCKILSSKEAMEVGLVDYILPDNAKFIEKGTDWLNQHLPESPEMAQAVKRMIIETSHHQQMSTALSKERHIFASVWGGPVHRAAMARFIKQK